MFNDDFYPTPDAVIDRLLEPLAKKATVYTDHPDYLYLPYSKILEPSAGKGDIVDRLVSKYHVERKKIRVIEIELELRAILSHKGFEIVSDDFTHFSDPYVIDCIIMNPPFSEGATHLLKAWEVLSYGDIACILNADTIRNPYSRDRQLLCDIIEKHGHYVEVGSVFQDAERPTDVECVFVYLHKEKAASSVNFDWETMGFERDWSNEDSDDSTPNFLANPDLIDAIVDQYNAAVRLSLHRLKLNRQIDRLLLDVTARKELSLEDREAGIVAESEKTTNEIIGNLKATFWDYVFRKTRLGSVTTSGYQKEFMEFQEGSKNLSFNRRNIMAIIDHFVMNRDQIFYDCINEVFELATSYHEKNKVWVEGWKTNKQFRVAPKIIMPRGIYYNTKSKSWSLGSYNERFYADIDKALCFVAGKKYEEIKQLRDVLYSVTTWRSGWKYPNTLTSEFFEIRLFKKGTVHLRFLDKDVLDRFNIAAANGRMWIGDNS